MQNVKKSQWTVRIFSVFLIGIILLFQNCSGQFKANESTSTNSLSVLPVCANGETRSGFSLSSALYPILCGSKVSQSCVSGQWSAIDPLYPTCSQQCVHPDSKQAVSSGSQYVSYSLSQASDQAGCDGAKIVSTCSSTTGQFEPKPETNKSCLVSGQTCPYTVTAETSLPTGNANGSTVTGFQYSSATYPTLCGGQVSATCQANGLWTNSVPLYKSCVQRCVHPDSSQPVDPNFSYVFYNVSTGSQSQCDAAKVNSLCQATSGTFSPSVSGTRFSTCSVVNPPIIVSFTAIPIQINTGDTSTLSWAVTGGTSISISPGVGLVSSGNSVVVKPTSTTIYSLTASNGYESVKGTFTVSVLPPNAGGQVTIANFSPMSLSSSILPNPDRGGLSDTGYNDMISNWQNGAPVNAGIAAGKRLGYCMFNLNAFTNSSISQSWLDTFQSRMNYMRNAGMGCVMMFYYDNYSGSGADASASQIVSHLQQLKPYFEANVDVIKYFKGGFVGAWGEWHSSKSCNSAIGTVASGCTAATAAENQTMIRDALFANVPSSMAVQFRQPPRVAEWYGNPLTAAESYSGNQKARAGIHNDCMLSGAPGDATGDTGTWWQWTGNLSASALRSFADSQTQFTPYGGELANNCAATQRTSCAMAKADFARWHLTWLKNSGGDSNFRNVWASEGCANEIENLQGYRVQLDSLSIPTSGTAGMGFSATLNLRNLGWSRSHYQRLIEIVFENGSSTFVCKSSNSLRDLSPQATASTVFTINCSIPSNAAKGNWNAYIRIPDIWTSTASMANFATRPANANSGAQSWDAAKYRFATGLMININ